MNILPRAGAVVNREFLRKNSPETGEKTCNREKVGYTTARIKRSLMNPALSDFLDYLSAKSFDAARKFLAFSDNWLQKQDAGAPVLVTFFHDSIGARLSVTVVGRGKTVFLNCRLRHNSLAKSAISFSGSVRTVFSGKGDSLYEVASETQMKFSSCLREAETLLRWNA